MAAPCPQHRAQTAERLNLSARINWVNMVNCFILTYLGSIECCQGIHKEGPISFEQKRLIRMSLCSSASLDTVEVGSRGRFQCKERMKEMGLLPGDY